VKIFFFNIGAKHPKSPYGDGVVQGLPGDGRYLIEDLSSLGK